MTTKIMQCKKCRVHKFQDTVYGFGRRVHNMIQNKNGNGHRWRCTVCLDEKDN